ncbi:kinase-associated lipoprotein B [Alkalihalobacillus sp. LMS39]|uniref:kinase-associated lipoprotein B n=1 Tax=Alkalihalobacillus sp. LMS39 TaxID=2924032 RepID=UPI001FB25C98|nr:kinase-associated lipoprotein B [Alkalihalobacillus sp. LMS39]UOE92245.1 kinase-associated lipoprotein B [Alkalihalobacillus sp. LMS39]
MLTEQQLQQMIGRYVRASYKTGLYVGEVLDVHPDKVLVKVVSVLKHPDQGDLHQPKQADVAFFHQRKALAQYEKVYVPLSTVKEYTDEIMEYKQSLDLALTRAIEQLQEKKTSWAEKSIEQLQDLRQDYSL